MQVEIKFKRTGSNSVYGSFQAGDLLRCSPAVAEHFVREGLAKYVESPVVSPPAANPDTAPAKKPKRVK
jgi:hypothetical protein